MTEKITPTKKSELVSIWIPSSGTRCCMVISGVLTLMLFVMNSTLTLYIDTSIPALKYITNQTRNTAHHSITQHINLKQTAWKIIDKLTNLTIGKPVKFKASAVKVKKCPPDFRRNHFMTCHRSGRTGNHLFQLATLIATAESTCYTAVLPKGTIQHIEAIFDIQNIEKRTHSTRSFKVLKESGWSIYMENITSLILPEFNWTLAGYRQSYRYFQNYSKLIKSSFQFKETIKREVVHYLENKTRVYKGLSVCMHVRRGDLVASRKALTSNLKYIDRAIYFYKKRLAPLNFSLVVSSDDIKWCAANIKGDKTYFSPFKNAGRDLFLLTQCNHSIMTVGSFGWFGAWLNETGMVVYDKTFSDNQVGHKPNDYFPTHWIGL